MSEAGREEDWTDLESLLRNAGAQVEDRPAAEGRLELPEAGEAESKPGEEGSALPYQDLLSELLGSWSEEDGGDSEKVEPAGQEREVPLSALMARLTEEPWAGSESSSTPAEGAEPEATDPGQGFGEPALSLEALQTRLLGEFKTAEEALPADLPAEEIAGVAQDGICEEAAEPPQEAREASPALEESPLAEESGLAGMSAELPLALQTPEPQPELGGFDGPAMPGTGFAIEAETWSQSAEADPEAAEPDTGAVAEDIRAAAGGVEPLWTVDLFEALVHADEADQTAVVSEDVLDRREPETMAAGPEGSGTTGAQSDGWEILASLPAPTPPSFSEPILFEPLLPADSTFDWPVVETHHRVAEPGAEQAAFEEAEAGAETEADESLRRLVGQMLAEMAAASAPEDQSQDTESATAKATERFLSFSLAGEVYAVALAGILETDRLPKVTRVPGLPAWAIGVSNLRGSILPVVDLRRLLSLEEAENPQDGRILVVRPAPGDAPSALVVDRLEGVALLSPGELHPAPLWLDSKILPYLEGIGSFKGRLVNVLDLGRLFAATGVSGDEPAKAGEAP